MENDEQLKRFFDQMKKQDEQLDIPAFPEVKTRKFNLWIPAGIAASMLFALLFIPKPTASIDKPTPEVVIITLQEDENQNQYFTIEESTFLDTWESPTASLLSEY